MTGGGFGGATISLITGDTSRVIETIEARFLAAFGREPAITEVHAAGGAGDVLIPSDGVGFTCLERRLGDGRYFIDYRFGA